jgi:toxin CptA
LNLTPYNAPSVLYPLGRSRFLGGLLLVGWLIAAGVTLWWWQASAVADWRPLLGCAASLLAAWAMATGWRRSPAGRLQWDGQRWRWESSVYRTGTALEPPAVVLDVQFALLLRLDNQAGAVWWLWAERSALPARWLDLRRAVYAKHRPTTLQDSEATEQALGELKATVEHPHSAPARHL